MPLPQLWPVFFFLALGSFVLSFLVSWQVKFIRPEFWPVARYNLIVLPFLYLANLALGYAFVRAHAAVKNLPFLSAAQAFFYYLFLFLFSAVLVGDRVPPAKALAGFFLIVLGIWVLKK